MTKAEFIAALMAALPDDINIAGTLTHTVTPRRIASEPVTIVQWTPYNIELRCDGTSESGLRGGANICLTSAPR